MSETSTIISSITGTAVPIEGDDIDTDRIMPARFLKEISFENMGKYLFADERFDEHGVKKHHPINAPYYRNATIMVVGKNFGCGSSREHAPQAIKRYGFQAIIGESFSEIFSGNCKAIGIPTIRATQKDIATLVAHIKKNPQVPITINLASKRIRYFEESIQFDIPDSHQNSFLTGSWNVLELLKSNKQQVLETANALPYFNNFND